MNIFFFSSITVKGLDKGLNRFREETNVVSFWWATLILQKNPDPDSSRQNSWSRIRIRIILILRIRNTKYTVKARNSGHDP